MKNLVVHFIQFVLLVSLKINISAQDNYLIQQAYFSPENGLSDRVCTSILEDNRGLIWVGTNDGLNRIEGNKVTSLTKAGDNIRLNRIEDLFLDNNGMIWAVETGSGILKSYLKIDKDPKIDIIDPNTLETKSINVYFAQLGISLQEKDFHSVLNTPFGIWIKSKSGKYFQFTNELNEIKLEIPTINYDYILKIGHKNNLAFIDNKIYRVNDEGSTYLLYNAGTKKIRTLWYSDKTIYVQIGNSLSCEVLSYSYENDTFNQCIPSITLPIIFHTVHRPFQEFTINGIGSFSQIGRDLFFTDIHGRDLNEIFNFSSKYLPCLMHIDSSDQIWILTEDGVFVIKINRNVIETYATNFDVTCSTRGITKLKDGRLLANSYLGQIIIDEDTSILNNNFQEVGLGILQDLNSNIWVPRHSGKVSLLSPYTYSELKTYNISVDTFLNGFSIIEDPVNKDIWVGGDYGVWIYNRDIDEFEKFTNLNGFDILNSASVLHLNPTQSGIWISSNIGIFWLDYNLGVTKHLTSEEGLINEDITFTFQDGNVLWAGTKNAGLLRYDLKSQNCVNLTTEDGLSDNTIHSIYPYKNSLWISSNYGLMCVDKSSYEVEVYLTQSGLTHNEFNRGSHFQDEFGKLYFGGVNGINSFYPEDLRNEFNTDFTIELLAVTVLKDGDDKKNSKINPYFDNELIEIFNDERFIELEFMNTFISDWENNQYVFKLNHHEKWKFVNDNSILISGLPFGENHIYIKGRNSEGKWSKNILKVSFNVIKPIYLRNSFLLSMFFLLGISVYLIKRQQAIVLQRRNQWLENEVNRQTSELSEINEAKNKLFRILAHDLRSPILMFQNLNEKVNFLIKRKDWKSLDAMSDQIENTIGRLSDMFDNLLPWVVTQSKIKEKSPTIFGIDEVIMDVLDELNPKIIEKGIEISLNIPLQINVKADRESVNIISRNLLSNSIKYSFEGGLIRITASIYDRTIKICFEDNGIGMKMKEINSGFSNYQISNGTKGEEGLGLGLKICHDLAYSNKGKITLKNKDEGGVVSCLMLPSDQES